jgi:PilZ domain
MDERRRYPRLPGPFDGAYDGASGARTARILDLNAGGCFIDVMGAPRTGERVTVSVSIGGRTATLAGEVVYVDRIQGFGVKFTANPPEQVEELDKMLRHNSP